MAELFVQPQLLDERLCPPLLAFVVFAICPSKMKKGAICVAPFRVLFFSTLKFRISN